MEKKKFIRLTTVDISLKNLLKGQLCFLNNYFDVIGVSADTGELQQVADNEQIRVIEIPMHREISLFADIKCLFLLIKLFRKEKPYILHTNTPKGSLLGLLAGKITKIPHRVYTVTGLRYHGASGLLRYILKTMERISCYCATNVIPEGQGILQSLQSEHITKKPLKVILNGNISGIDTNFFSLEATNESLASSAHFISNKSPQKQGAATCVEDFEFDGRKYIRNQLNIQSNEFTFVFVGRIVKDKGICELVETMKYLTGQGTQIPSVKLILVGSFEQGDPIPTEDENWLKCSLSVRMVGWQDDVRPYLLAADALVFPSYREGFPNVVMQAGAMGLPSIVTDINGSNEIIENETNGIIIESRDSHALLQAMERLVRHPEDAKRMAQNARRMIQARYEQKDVWQALLQFYQTL